MTERNVRFRFYLATKFYNTASCTACAENGEYHDESEFETARRKFTKLEQVPPVVDQGRQLVFNETLRTHNSQTFLCCTVYGEDHFEKSFHSNVFICQTHGRRTRISLSVLEDDMIFLYNLHLVIELCDTLAPQLVTCLEICVKP